jgi:hypothetical protein
MQAGQHVMPSLSDHLRTRLFEWATTFMMFGIAEILLLNPASMETSGFRLLREGGLSSVSLGIFLMVFATARVGGLWANGVWPRYGPRLRAVGAVGGAVVWGQMALALVWWSLDNNRAMIGIPIFVVLAVGELICCYRAAFDVRTKHR